MPTPIQCQRPHFAGDLRYAETWTLLPGCDRDATLLVLGRVLAAQGGPYSARAPREALEVVAASCGACAAPLLPRSSRAAGVRSLQRTGAWDNGGPLAMFLLSAAAA